MLTALLFVCVAGTPVQDCTFDTALRWQVAPRSCYTPWLVQAMTASLRHTYVKRVCLPRDGGQ